MTAMRVPLLWLCFVINFPVAAETKNLLRQDLYLRPGFNEQWLKVWPERSKSLEEWRHIPAVATDNRPVRIGHLGDPFPKPGLVYWPVAKIHEYTAVTRFFLTPEEIKKPHAWGLRLGSIADNWQIYLNGSLIAEAWYPDATGERLRVHRAVRDLLVELPHALLVPGENILAFRFAGDKTSSEVGFFIGQPYEVGALQALLRKKSETVVLILIFLYLAVGLYHLLLYLWRRKERYNLFFGIFCVGLFSYLFTRTTVIFQVINDTQLIHRVEFIVVFNLLTAFLAFIDTLTGDRIHPFTKIYGSFAGILSLAVVPSTDLFNTTVLRVWQIGMLIGIGYFVFFRLAPLIGAEIRLRLAQQVGKNAVVRVVRSFLATLLHTPPGNLLIGILTIVGTAIFDILDSMFFSTGIAFTKYGFAIFVLGIAVMLANRFLQVHNAVEELNATLEKKVEERTRELQESLKRVQELKTQQDADYFLTSLLLKPLSANHARSDTFTVEHLIKQKKTFEFRKWKSEIGGDINIAASITLKEQPYVVFVNADAMGKSIQGAGGALVLGAVFQSTIERMRWTRELSDVFPEIWLHTTFLELHRIFESFEGSMLISLVIGLIEEKTGLLYYINAEHPRIVLLRDGVASFLESDMLRKLGTPGIKGTLKIYCFQLMPGDILVMGSDGRDDLVLGHNADGTSIVNENEQLFLEHVQATGGDLQKIYERLQSIGEIMDDLSLIRVIYQPQAQADTGDRTAEIAMLRQQAEELWRAGQLSEACGLYLKLSSLLPLELDFCYRIAQCLRRDRKIRQALQWAERCVLREPDNLHYLLLAAELNIMVRRFQKAGSYLRRVRKLYPDHERAVRLESLLANH